MFGPAGGWSHGGGGGGDGDGRGCVGATISALVPDPRRAGAVKVEVDGRLMWTVTREAAEQEGLRQGQLIDEPLAQRLERAADEEAAVRTALRSLERRPFARRDLSRRLVRKGHQPEAVEAALDRLDTMGLLDDAAFAELYVQSKAPRGQGPRRLLHDLRGLGVADEVASEAVRRTFPPGYDLGPVVQQLAAKRAGQLGDLPPAVKRRRLMAYLTRRGFGGSEVVDAVKGVVAAGAP